MNGSRRIAAAAAGLIVLTGACGADVSGDTWLIVAGGDTATVAEVGAAWSRMGDANRELFTGRDNALGQFLLTYARRMMLEREIEASGLLSDPGLVAMGAAWLRFNASAEALDSLRSRERSRITEEEIRFFLDHAGRLVWYTLRPGGPGEEIRGPEHLPEIVPVGLAFQLDSMEMGEILPGTAGIPVRLDSVLAADPSVHTRILADSAASRESAMESLMLTRAAARMEVILGSMHGEHSVRIDSVLVESLAAWYRDGGDFPEGILLDSDVGSWSTRQLRDELTFLSSRMFTEPDSGPWLLYCLDNLLLQILLIEEGGLPAHRLDSLLADRDAFLLDLASERLYARVVSSSVTVTEEDIRHQFESMTEPVILREERVLRAALLPESLADDYDAAAENGTLEAFRDGLGGIPGLQASPDTDPQLTRAVSQSQVPGGYGPLVFGDAAADSSGWMGPYRLEDTGDFVLFRVEEVHPPREAGLEDIRTQLERTARLRLEEEATLRWMQQLEAKYSLDIHEEALDRLPGDPALWCDL